MRATHHDVAEVGEATVLYDIESDAGMEQMQRGHFDEAIQFWSQTLAINPAMVVERANLAAALFRTGQAEQAQAVMRKALEFNPSFQAARDFLERTAK